MEGLAAVVEVADERLHLGADAFGSEHAGHQHGDDTHGLRRVVGAMTDAESRRGKVLQDFEKQLPMLLSESEIGLSEAEIEPITGYLVYDKKNLGDKPQFVLLESVGKPIWDVEVEKEMVKRSLEYIVIKVSSR